MNQILLVLTKHFWRKFNFEGKNFKARQKYRIFGTTMDMIEERCLEIPDYIKIDIDGLEHLILEELEINYLKIRK